MSKIELPNVTSGYNLSTINNNFQKIEDTLNKEVLYRKGYLGEPNEMQTNLDMNGKQILNVTTGTSDGSLVTKGYVDQGLALKFDKSGGPLSGPIDMGNNEILNTSRLSTDTLEVGGVPIVPTDLAIYYYNETREALRRSYAEAGYNLVAGSFEAGGVVTSVTDVLLHEATGVAYTWGGALPKSVKANSTPATTGGISASGWVPRTDVLLRSEIQVADYHALRAYSGTLSAVYVTGTVVTAKPAGIAGQFIWDSTDTTSPDDGGTVLVDALGRRWKRQYEKEVNALWFEGVTPNLTSSSSTKLAWIVDNFMSVYIPAGDYLMDSSVRIRHAGQVIRGEGKWLTKFWVDAGNFTSATYAGDSGMAAFWVIPDGTWNDGSWIDGVNISDFSVYGNDFLGECLRLNRVINGEYSNLNLVGANYGIYGNRSGWGSSFSNIRSADHVIGAIGLFTAYNGCTFTGCTLWGGNKVTQVLLNIQGDSYGNSFNGGYIENGFVGVNLVNSQLAINGVDFEVIAENFVRVVGNSNFAAPPSSVTACTFVGTPSASAGNVFYVDTGSISVRSSFFWNQGDLPGANTFIFNGNSGADVQNGYMQPCISESDNNIRGWGNGDQYYKGSVFGRSKAHQFGSVSTGKLITGTNARFTLDTDTWNAELTGYTMADKTFGFNVGNSAGVVTYCNSSLGYGSIKAIDAAGSNSAFIANHPEKFTSRITHGSNFQGDYSFGSIELTVQAVNGSGVAQSNTVVVDGITNSVKAAADNVMSLGVGSSRWTTVYAATGAINTSDAREKTAPHGLDDSVLDAWGDVQIIAFQWLSSIQEKGDDAARWHFGVIAQQVRDAFSARGLNGTDYGLLCYDEWEDVYAPVMGTRENQDTGEPEEYDTGEVVLVLAKGDRWGIRPDQCLFLEAAYQRRNYQRLAARVEALEVK